MKYIAAGLCITASLIIFKSSAAETNIRCGVTYSGNGDTMQWTFAPAKEADAFVEVSYSKNKEAEVYNDPQYMPLWTTKVDNEKHLAVLSSRVDPGYYIGYELNPSPHAGEALLFHEDVQTAAGHCWPLDKPDQSIAEVTGDSVPLMIEHGAMFVDVDVSGHPLKMLIDTGANLSSIPADLADQLISQGRATEGEGIDVTLADGSTSHERTLTIDTLSIGSRYTREASHGGCVRRHVAALLPPSQRHRSLQDRRPTRNPDLRVIKEIEKR